MKKKPVSFNLYDRVIFFPNVFAFVIVRFPIQNADVVENFVVDFMPSLCFAPFQSSPGPASFHPDPSPWPALGETCQLEKAL